VDESHNRTNANIGTFEAPEICPRTTVAGVEVEIASHREAGRVGGDINNRRISSDNVLTARPFLGVQFFGKTKKSAQRRESE